jgi:plastocyanin
LAAVVLATGAYAASGALAAAVETHPGSPDAPGPAAEPGAMPMTTAVSMGFSDYLPQTVQVVPGDVIRWTNDSARAHSVTADDGTFDSGRLPTASVFERRVDAAGVRPYHCTLHTGMVGTIEAWTLLLNAPERPAAPGRAFPLGGRASLAAGTSVRIQADTGNGFTDVAQTVTQADGTFSAQVTPRTSGPYRAVAGADASPPVALLVLDHTVTLSASRAQGQDTVRVRVTPPDPGADVVLQLRIPERFGWWPVRHALLDKDSGARFTVRTRRRLAARVQLTLRDMATPLAGSRRFHVGPPPRHRHR